MLQDLAPSLSSTYVPNLAHMGRVSLMGGPSGISWRAWLSRSSGKAVGGCQRLEVCTVASGISVVCTVGSKVQMLSEMVSGALVMKKLSVVDEPVASSKSSAFGGR